MVRTYVCTVNVYYVFFIRKCLCVFYDIYYTIQGYVQFYIAVDIHTMKFKDTIIHILDPPDIDEGSHVPRPSVVIRGNRRVNIGTPVYVHDGFDVIIDCNIVNGTPPIIIQWFHNGSPDLSRGNFSTITVINATSNGDVFTCRAENIEGFDTESTVINVDYGTYVCMHSKCVSCIFHM